MSLNIQLDCKIITVMYNQESSKDLRWFVAFFLNYQGSAINEICSVASIYLVGILEKLVYFSLKHRSLKSNKMFCHFCPGTVT